MKGGIAMGIYLLFDLFGIFGGVKFKNKTPQLSNLQLDVLMGAVKGLSCPNLGT